MQDLNPILLKLQMFDKYKVVAKDVNEMQGNIIINHLLKQNYELVKELRFKK